MSFTSSVPFNLKLLHQCLCVNTTSITNGPSYLVNYSYNASGKRTSMSSDYISLVYDLDSGSRLRGVTNNQGMGFSFYYDGANRLTEITRPNGVNSTYSFDNNSFLREISHLKGGNLIEKFIYTRDEIGNKLTLTSSRGVATYSYDNENQLIASTHPEADALHALEEFNYDSLGNRTSDNHGSYSYDDKRHRLEEDWKYVYVYDLNGNLTSKQEKGLAGTVWNYIYSSENQLIQVDYFEDGAKKREVFFRYDVQGRRVLKLVRDLQLGTEDEKRYAYDGSEIIAELDEGNNILTRYTHSGLRTDDVLAVEVTSAGVSRGLAQASGNYLYLKDSLGSIQAITDIYGNIVQRYVYSSFGKLLKVTDDMGNEITPFVKNAFTYTNREWDEEIGLYYYRARYYDPALGRFLTEDPHPGKLAIPSTFNTKYTYVANNPMNLIDPTGESWVSDVLIIATVTVAIVATSGMAAGAYATWGAALMSSASAVGATAIGSALAAGALSAFEGGDFMQNFGNNFKSIFTISAAALAGSAIFHASAGTFASAGANTWYQGGIRATEGGGLTLFAASSYGPGLAGHEAGHTVQYIIQAGALSAGNKYGGVGMSGRDLRYALHAGYLANGLVGIPQVGNDGALW